MRYIHLPVWMEEVNRPRASTFAILFSLVAMARTLLLVVIPLQANETLADVGQVSILYFVVSMVSLCGSISIPTLVHKLRRRWVFTIGASAAIVGYACLMTGTLVGLVAGLTLQLFSVAAMEITLNLYLMDHIPRKELTRFEPMRIFAGAAVWSGGPMIGVLLKAEFGLFAPYAVASAVAAAALGYFWLLRFKEDPSVAPMKTPPPKPIRYIGHFFAQPRLRLAWTLALGRSAWWSMFFIYAPIYVFSAGFGEQWSGAIVSVGNLMVFLVPIWGWVGRRYGLRQLLVAGYLISGAMAVSVALVSGTPWLGVVALLLGAMGASIIDGGGNVPFLRAVHPYERSEMTAVFTTYRDVGQLAPPGVFSLLLKAFELPAVFAAGGVAMMCLAFVAKFIPRRM